MRHALRLCNAAALRLPAAAHLLPAASGATRSHSAAAYVQNNDRNFPDITVEFRAAAPGSLPDPFALVQPQLRPLDSSIRELVGTDHPVLAAAAHHFFERAGKRFRPTLVLLSSAAAAGGDPADARQQRLAEITEMIHAASLLHDDVIDVADTRRGAKTAHRIYGNKVAVLAGDFLLARPDSPRPSPAPGHWPTPSPSLSGALAAPPPPLPPPPATNAGRLPLLA